MMDDVQLREDPVRPVRIFQRVDWMAFGVTALLAFAVHLYTLPPECRLDDAGSFITGSTYLGVADPPGYPL